MNETKAVDENVPEPWLRGTLTEVSPVIRAVLHALELAKEDIWTWCHPLTLEQLNQSIGRNAPVAFHLKHIARSLDRLLSCAEGAQLNETQLMAKSGELEAASSREQVFEELSAALEWSKKRLLALQGVDFAAARVVGRKQLSTTWAG